jgi:hypothetical protein
LVPGVDDLVPVAGNGTIVESGIMNWNLLGRFIGTALLTGIVLSVSVPAEAGPIKGFMGNTRPGVNATPHEKTKDIEKVAFDKLDDPKQEGFGVTIYFMVVDRVDGTVDDPWGLASPDLLKSWIAGREGDGVRGSATLDTKARYLYLYQIINDVGEPGQIKTVFIRMFVDPEYITSWGWLGEKKEKDKNTKAVGFSMEFPPEKDRDLVRPVSSSSPGVSDHEYQQLAPAFAAPKPYGMSPISMGNIRKVAANGESDDRGREPERLLLLNESSELFGAVVWDKNRGLLPIAQREGAPRLFRPIVAPVVGRDDQRGLFRDDQQRGQGRDDLTHTRLVDPYRPLTQRAVGYDPYAPLRLLGMDTGVRDGPGAPPVRGGVEEIQGLLPGVVPVGFGADIINGRTYEDPLVRLATAADQNHRSFPALRVDWLDRPLRPGERSTLFGFTSNLPPMYDKARVKANRLDTIQKVAVNAPDVRPASMGAAGVIPTPVPPVSEAGGAASAPPAAIAGGSLGSFGGGGSTGGGGTTGGGGPGGGGFPGLGGGLGGGFASPGQGQTGSQGQTGTQNGTQGQNQTQPQQQNVTVNVAQQQAMAQAQAQLQAQQQQQQQKQTLINNCNCHPNHHVIPEPAALLTTTLCLPVLALFYRRRKPVVPEETPADKPVI